MRLATNQRVTPEPFLDIITCASCASVFLQINCYLKGEAGEERKLDGATTGWKGEGCESPRRKEKGPAETGLLDNEGRREGAVQLLLNYFASLNT